MTTPWIFPTLLAIAVRLLTPQGQALTNSEEFPVLSERVGEFHIENLTMEDGLRALRQTNPVRILIGFEKVAHNQNEKDKLVSLSLSDATVGQIIDGLCRQDPKYTYEIVSGLLHVYPKNGQSDPAGLLSLRVSKFSIADKMTPAAIIQRIGDLAPELVSFMSTKQEEYYVKSGLSPGGSPGSIMSGNMDPEIHLDLHDMTVREILNAVVLYSRQLRDQTPAGIGGYKTPPTSWAYEFIIDPDASNGLGGTPHWNSF